ncbi:MAG: DUF998 domain-containing protein [Cellulophaga sp.]|uniref:DUF998 domain-containing protein n=1 Tax=Cellulophaga sp. TaxID=1972202 RepID=UPI00326553D2
MSNKTVYVIGVLATIIFISSALIGGLLIDDYSVTSQYISETYAVDTEYGVWLRILGYIPSGILFTIFCFVAIKYFPSSKLIKTGFLGVGVFYGIGTIVTSIFACDSGCNPEFINPSISQVIHNLSALLIYAIVPISIIIAGIGLTKFSKYKALSFSSIILGTLSAGSVFLLFSNLQSDFLGLYQRVIELLILTWVLICAFRIKKTGNNDLN